MNAFFRIAAALFVAAFPAVHVAACSSGSNSSAGFKLDAGSQPPPGPGDSGSMLDASTPACVPADVSDFSPGTYQPASGTEQGLCTTSLIESFLADCVGSGATAQKCAPWFEADANNERTRCGACILSAETDEQLGPLVTHPLGGRVIASVNVPGCYQLRGNVGCAKALQALEKCDTAACTLNCGANLDDYNACFATTNQAGCSAYFDDAKDCFAAPEAAWCSGDDHVQDVIALFCGAMADAGGAFDAAFDVNDQ